MVAYPRWPLLKGRGRKRLDFERQVMRKVAVRLIPFLFVLYIVAFIDRVNVSFAKLQMNTALGFDEAIYGMGAGLFFWGYFFFELPSNLILQRVGARFWIARIMVTWGLLAMGMLFLRSATSFYVMRFLLGAAEAGFFPGIILYLTYWFTSRERARVIGLFMTATAISGVIGGPVSGLLLSLHGWGLAGWQWLYLLEGMPAVLLAGVVLYYLPDRPEKARWLLPEERALVRRRLEEDHQLHAASSHHVLGEALRKPAVWQLSLVYLLIVTGNYGVSLWIPSLIKEFRGISDFQVGMLTALPSLAGAVGLVLNGIHSDRTQERILHVALPAGACALFLMVSTYLHTPFSILSLLCMASFCYSATLGPFWSLPTTLLRGTAAAAGIALVNSIGNLGGSIGPMIMGFTRESSGGFQKGLRILAVSYVFGALVALTIRYRAARPDTP